MKTSKEIDLEYQEKYERGEIDMFGGAYPTPHGEDGHNSLFYLGLETEKYVALDAETYALRGTAKDPHDHKNTFAISITDSNGKSKTFIYLEEDKACDFVKENVLPVMEIDPENTVICNSYEEMITLAKKELIEKYPGHDILVHCGSPVEYNVLREMDRVSTNDERIYDRTVVDMGDMVYFKDGEIKEVGDSVNKTNEDLKVEHYGNDHNPEADNINAIRCLKAIQEQNKEYLKNLSINKENINEFSDKEVGLYFLHQLKEAYKTLAERDDFNNNTYECGNFKEGKSFENGYQATFFRPLDYGCDFADHDNGKFSSEEFGKLIKHYSNSYENDGKIYIGVFEGEPEISFRYTNEEDAIKVCEETNQHSRFEWSSMEVIPNPTYISNVKEFDNLLTEDKLTQIQFKRDIEEGKILPNSKYVDYYEEKFGSEKADKMDKIYNVVENLKTM